MLKILPGILRGDELRAEPVPHVKLPCERPAWVLTQGCSRTRDLFISEVVLRRAHPLLYAVSSVLGGLLLRLQQNHPRVEES